MPANTNRNRIIQIIGRHGHRMTGNQLDRALNTFDRLVKSDLNPDRPLPQHPDPKPDKWADKTNRSNDQEQTSKKNSRPVSIYHWKVKHPDGSTWDYRMSPSGALKEQEMGEYQIKTYTLDEWRKLHQQHIDEHSKNQEVKKSMNTTITKAQIAEADAILDRLAKATTPAQNRQIIDRIKQKQPLMLMRSKPTVEPAKSVPTRKPAPKQSPAPAAQKPVTAQQPQEDLRPRWGSPVPLWGLNTRPASTPLPPSPELPKLPPKRAATNLGSEGHKMAAVKCGLQLDNLPAGTDLTRMSPQDMRKLASQQTIESVKGIAAQHAACYRTDPRKRRW